MPDTELGQQCIDGSELHSVAATLVSKIRRADVILTVRLKHWYRGEALNDQIPILWSGKTLQQFLQDQAGGHNHVVAGDRVMQSTYLGCVGHYVEP